MSNFIEVAIPRRSHDPDSTIIAVAVFDRSLTPDILDPTYDSFIALLSPLDPRDLNFDGEVSFGERLLAGSFPANFTETRLTQHAYKHLGLVLNDARFNSEANNAAVSATVDLTAWGFSKAYGIEQSVLQTIANKVGGPILSSKVSTLGLDFWPQAVVKKGTEHIWESLTEAAFAPPPRESTGIFNYRTPTTSLGESEHVVFMPDDENDAVSFVSGRGNDLLIGGNGGSNLRSEGGNNTIVGGTGNDTLSGGDGSDVIFGGAGRNLIFNGGGYGNDILGGGPGDDTIHASGFGVLEVDGNGGFNELRLTRGHLTEDQDIVVTPEGSFTLTDGTTVRNIQHLSFLQTGSGNDRLNMRIDPDLRYSWDAGAGHDTAVLDFSDWTANITLRPEQIRTNSHLYDPAFAGAYQHGGGWVSTGIVLTNVQQFHITGGAGDDRLTGGAYDDFLYGGAGNDYIHGGDGAGNDTLLGGEGDDTIVAGGTGVHEIDGGPGFDELRLTRGHLTEDQDIVVTPEGSFTLTDGTTVRNIQHLSYLQTGSGNDRLTMRIDPDLRYSWDAGAGHDTAVLDFSDWTANITLRPEQIRTNSHLYDPAFAGAYQHGGGWVSTGIVLTNVQQFHITGGAGDDRLTGGAYDDFLYGGAGNDILSGGAGNDTLVGGTGKNTLTGGTGSDLFVISKGSISNEITDFTPGEDHLAFAGFTAAEMAMITGFAGDDGFQHFLLPDGGLVLLRGIAFDPEMPLGVWSPGDTAPVIGGDLAGMVTEDDPARLSTEGVLILGTGAFAVPDPAALQGLYGVFSFDPDNGSWIYALDNDAEAVRALPEGAQVTDRLTIASLDGTVSGTISVTVTGAGVRDDTPLESENMVILIGQVVDRAGKELSETSLTFTPHGAGTVTLETDVSGRFAFEVPEGSAGHLDASRGHSAGDPSITTASALETLRMALGLNPSWGSAAPMDYIAADFNGDGRVTTADALGILRVAVGLRADDAPRWVFLDPDADLSEVDRSNAGIETGRLLEPLAAASTNVSLTGILVGHVQEYP